MSLEPASPNSIGVSFWGRTCKLGWHGGWLMNEADWWSGGLTATGEVGEVDGDVVLITGQFA